MGKTVLDFVSEKLDKVDACRDDDWVSLGEMIQNGILGQPEYAGEFTELQKKAIISACRETYYASAVIARAYAYTAVSELAASLSREFKS